MNAQTRYNSDTQMNPASAKMRFGRPYQPVPLPAPTDDAEQCKADVARTGLCILEGALMLEALERTRDLLYRSAQEDRDYGGGDRHNGADHDDANQRVWGLLNRGQPFIDLAEHPASVALLTHLLGRNFLLSSMSANITGPGHGGMVMHSDQLFVPQPWPDAPQGVNVFWLLDDFTEENGGTLVAPGSHLTNRAAVDGQDEHALVPLVGKAGSMVVMDGRVWHRTGANRTKDQRRAGVFGWYVAPIYRTQENWFLSLNPLILRRNPSEALLRMLGYRVEGMVFGHVNGYEPLPKTLDW